MKKVPNIASLKKFTPVLVKWRDPCGYSGWFNSEKLAKDIRKDGYAWGIECTTVALFVDSRPDGIVVGMTHGDSSDNDVANLFVIPKGVIDAIYELE